MREILFRGKRKDNGELIVGHLLWYEDGRARITPRHTDIFRVEGEDIIQHIAYEVFPETVGQYTGLTDKNGTKIFEGDIIRESYGCRYDDFYIKFIKGRFVTVYIPTDRSNYSWYEGDSEIVGNIHNNPELFKGGAE